MSAADDALRGVDNGRRRGWEKRWVIGEDSPNNFRGDDFAGSAPGCHAVDDHDAGFGFGFLEVVHARVGVLVASPAIRCVDQGWKGIICR